MGLEWGWGTGQEAGGWHQGPFLKEPGCLGWNPGSTASSLGDLGQVAYLSGSQVYSSIK